MIHYLKESTFAVKEVLDRSWLLLKSRYFAIAGLCFALFLTSNTSGILAFYLKEINPVLSAFMAFLFMIAYFGIQLTLFKYLMHLIDNKGRVFLSESIPSTKEMLYFLTAMLGIGVSLLVFYLVISVAAWPLIYWVGVDMIMEINLFVFGALSFFFLLRIAFFPFFIIDQGQNVWGAIRMSVALTKGNVVKILLIMTFFVILHLLYVYFNWLGYPVISTILSVISSFFVVPLSSVVIAMAFKDMMKGFIR